MTPLFASAQQLNLENIEFLQKKGVDFSGTNIEDKSFLYFILEACCKDYGNSALSLNDIISSIRKVQEVRNQEDNAVDLLVNYYKGNYSKELSVYIEHVVFFIEALIYNKENVSTLKIDGLLKHRNNNTDFLSPSIHKLGFSNDIFKSYYSKVVVNHYNLFKEFFDDIVAGNNTDKLLKLINDCLLYTSDAADES